MKKKIGISFLGIIIVSVVLNKLSFLVLSSGLIIFYLIDTKVKENMKYLSISLFLLSLAILGLQSPHKVKAEINLEPKIVSNTLQKSQLSTSSKKTPTKRSSQYKLELGELDQLQRATWAHIVLKNSDEPANQCSVRLTYNPVGWHNYKFFYEDGHQKAWLMNRGHLIGYQFSGLTNESRNLVPMTAWLNAGHYKKSDKNNEASMLYYESRLDKWLEDHPNYWLDYKVSAVYTDNELIPRQIRLEYYGINTANDKIAIKVGGSKESSNSDDVITSVILENVSNNATIDYATGTATNTVQSAKEQARIAQEAAKQQAEQEKAAQETARQQAEQEKAAQEEAARAAQEAAAQEAAQAAQAQAEQRIVYVTGGGKSDVYWYSTDRMPWNTNKNNIISMTEAEAISRGKRHSQTE